MVDWNSGMERCNGQNFDKLDSLNLLVRPSLILLLVSSPLFRHKHGREVIINY